MPICRAGPHAKKSKERREPKQEKEKSKQKKPTEANKLKVGWSCDNDFFRLSR
jgi:hypothetical protein